MHIIGHVDEVSDGNSNITAAASQVGTVTAYNPDGTLNSETTLPFFNVGQNVNKNQQVEYHDKVVGSPNSGSERFLIAIKIKRNNGNASNSQKDIDELIARKRNP